MYGKRRRFIDQDETKKDPGGRAPQHHRRSGHRLGRLFQPGQHYDRGHCQAHEADTGRDLSPLSEQGCDLESGHELGGQEPDGPDRSRGQRHHFAYGKDGGDVSRPHRICCRSSGCTTHAVRRASGRSADAGQASRAEHDETIRGTPARHDYEWQGMRRIARQS